MFRVLRIVLESRPKICAQRRMSLILVTDYSKAVILVYFLFMFIVVGVLCRISYSVINYSHISFSGLITSVGEERANCSIFYLHLCDFCSEGFPFPLGV